MAKKKKRVSKKMQKKIDARLRREKFYSDRREGPDGTPPKVEVKNYQYIDPAKGDRPGNYKEIKESQNTRTAGDGSPTPNKPKMKKVEADGWSPDGGKTWIEYNTGKELTGFDKEGNKMVPAQKNPAAYKMKASSIPGVFKSGGTGKKYTAKMPGLFKQGVKGLKK